MTTYAKVILAVQGGLLIAALAAFPSSARSADYPGHMVEVGSIMVDADDFEDGTGVFLNYRHELGLDWEGFYVVGEIGSLGFDAFDRDFAALGGEWHKRGSMRTSIDSSIPVTGVLGAIVGQERYSSGGQDTDDLYGRAYYDVRFETSQYFHWGFGVQWDLREAGNRRNGGVRLGVDWRFSDAAKLRIQASQDETEMTVRAGLQWAF